MKKILGMGNALVDIMIPLQDDTILEQLQLPKGSMQLVDLERSNAVLNTLAGYPRSLSAGGSAANTIHGLAKLGAPTGYIGSVGEDELGGFFVRDMIQAGVEPMMLHSLQETGRAVALVSPDSERTFATFLGAAVELSAQHLDNNLWFQHPASSIQHPASIFHLEGYLVFNEALILKAVQMAKQAGLKVSIDMASYNVVAAKLDFFTQLVKEYIDILFANEEEAKAFTGQAPEEALDIISEWVEISVVKTGSQGSLIRHKGETHRIGIIPAQPIDTTGAGDLYASGFLYGLAAGMPLKRCGELGALLAGNVIECMGSKMDEARWISILQQI